MALYVYEVKHGCTHVETMQCQLVSNDVHEGALVLSIADLRELREKSRRKLCTACVDRKAKAW